MRQRDQRQIWRQLRNEWFPGTEIMVETIERNKGFKRHISNNKFETLNFDLNEQTIKTNVDIGIELS